MKQAELVAKYDTTLRNVQELLSLGETEWALNEVKALIAELDEEGE